MTLHGWIALLSSLGQLALFTLAVRRAPKNALAFPLAQLSVALFSWSFGRLAGSLWGQREWLFLSAAAFPVANAIAMHLLLSFVGRRRSLSWLMYLSYIIFGGYSFIAIFAFVNPWAAAFVSGPRWSVVYALLTLPALIAAAGLFVSHVRRAGAEEQARAWLLVVAMVFAVVLASTELAADLGFDVPRLGDVGALGANMAVAFVVMRLKLLGRDLSTATFVYAFMLAALALGADLGLIRLFQGHLGLLLAGTVSLTLVLLAVFQRFLRARSLTRERIDRLATMGRFSAQMAHDLKNPLAALRGAAQFLQTEHARGSTLADRGEFFALLVEQADRLERVIDRYQRLGRVEPALKEGSLNDVVRSVLALQQLAPSTRHQVATQLSQSLPPCRLDVDLAANAFENVVRNALEAMPDGGTVTVRTGSDGNGEVFVSVDDTGEGMDARTRERAFDDFYTTKPQGSGLGLAFVRRVVDAHGGEVTLSSREGVGTSVRLAFPIRPTG